MKFARTIFVLCCLCGCTRNARQEHANPAFEATNLITSGGIFQTIIRFTNGVSIVHEADQIVLNVSNNYSASAFYHPTSMIVRRVVQEVRHPNQPGFWFFDIDGNGMPDVRRTMGQDGRDILVDGVWVQVVNMNGSNWSANVNGDTREFTFRDGVWIDAIADKTK